MRVNLLPRKWIKLADVKAELDLGLLGIKKRQIMEGVLGHKVGIHGKQIKSGQTGWVWVAQIHRPRWWRAGGLWRAQGEQGENKWDFKQVTNSLRLSPRVTIATGIVWQKSVAPPVPHILDTWWISCSQVRKGLSTQRDSTLRWRPVGSSFV